MNKQKTNYLLFKNEGEIDVNYLSLLGISTKEDDDTKIGFWGSGLKYALATLLRNDISVKIFSGKKEIKVEKVKTKVVDDYFDVIHINGEKTSITTKAGKDWELWFAIREIHSNQLDCGESSMELSNEPSGLEGQTRIFIELNDDINEISKNYDKYFSFKRTPIFENIHGKVFTKKGSLFRKGIRANDKEYNTIFDYDFNNIDINESRVFCYNFQVKDRIAEIISKLDNNTYIEQLFSKFDCFEHTDADYSSISSFSNEIVNYLKKYTIVNKNKSGYAIEEGVENPIFLDENIFKALKKYHRNELKFFGDKHDSNFSVIENQEQFKEKLNSALISIREDKNNHDIKVCFIDGDILGEYDKNTGIIFLDESIFESTKLLQNTLLEEILHKESGYGDKTRQFQNHIINRLRLSLIE